jgi:SAM-dependent methyltransferase
MTSRPSSFVKHLISKAATPYRTAGMWAWLFARGKLGGDPVFTHLLADGLLTGRPRILDIGCGQGLLTSWLLAAQASSAKGNWPESWAPAPQPEHVRGIELMAHDVVRADNALAPAVSAGRASFVQADMCKAEFGAADAVVILDVLHYVPLAAQDEVLARVRRSLPPGGVLLLRVGDAAGGLRFSISNWVDHVVTTLRGHRLGTLYCRPLSAWKDTLTGLGFVVDAQSMSQGTPFANVLLVARLRPDA